MDELAEVLDTPRDEMPPRSTCLPPTRPIAPRTSLAARWTPRVLPPLLYLAGSAYLYSHFLARPDSGVPGGPDGLIYVWYFEWERQAVLHMHNPFFSSAMNAPFGVNVMWNAGLWLLAVVCAPLTAVIGPFAVVGLMMMLSPVISASVAYFVFRRLTNCVLGSAIAAPLYGFGPFFVGHNAHLHLIFAPFPPLLLLFLYRLCVQQGSNPARTGVALGVVTGAAVLVTQEIVALSLLTALFALIVLAVLNLGYIRGHARHIAVGLSTAALVALCVACVPLGYQFFGRQALPGGVTAPREELDLAGLVRPGTLQYYSAKADVLANRRFPANVVENTGYLGWPLLLVATGFCLWMLIRRERFVAWWLATSAFTIALSLGSFVRVNGHVIGVGPWALVHQLPMMNGAIASRFTLLTSLLVALILAWGLARLRGRTFAAGVLVVTLALIPLCPFGRYGFIERDATPRFFTTNALTAITSGANVLVLPSGGSPFVQAPAMAWQVRAHMRFNLIGGYGVFNLRGRMSYIGSVPAFARLLINTGRTGVLPNQFAIVSARLSVSASHASYIVITDLQPRRGVVANLSEALTGCRVRRAADVELCAISQSSR